MRVESRGLRGRTDQADQNGAFWKKKNERKEAYLEISERVGALKMLF